MGDEDHTWPDWPAATGPQRPEEIDVGLWGEEVAPVTDPRYSERVFGGPLNQETEPLIDLA